MKKITYFLVLIVLIALQSCQNGNSSNPATTSVDNEAIIKHLEGVKGVLPPFENVDVPFSTYIVDADKGKTIQTETGTVIIIPKGAFKDANGKPVTGNVEVTYREFHDAAAIIASGIPMTNAEGDKYMETAGMFEINGSQSGQSIAIAADKAIEVKMGSFVEGENFDFFYFDKKSCNWENKGTSKPEKNIVKLEKINNLPKVPNQPIKPKKYEEDAFVFDLDINYESFPELRAYHDVIWQYAGSGKNPKENKWVFQENWATIDVKSITPESGTYQLTLKNNKNSFTTNITPVLKGLNYENAIAAFQKKNEDYQRLKTERIEEEKRVSGEASLVRSFQVSQFGIHNWDIWKNPNRRRCIANFDFDQEEINDIHKISVFLVTGSQRSVVRYSPNDFNKFSFDPNDDNLLIAVLPDNKLAYFKTSDFAKINLSSIKEDKIYTFKMKINSTTVASIDDLEKIIDSLS